MATLLGSSWGDFQTYMKYSTSSTSTTYSVTFTEGGIKQNCSYSAYPFEGTLSATAYDSVSTSISNKTRYAGYHALFTTDRTFTWSRKQSAYTVAIRVTCGKDISGGSSGYVRKEFTVPALASYKVTFKPNGGTGGPSSQTKYYGKTLTLSNSKPTRSGYTFVGWGTSSTDTSKNYDPGDSYTANASETLYAIWKKTITLTFNDNGGSGQPAAKSVTVYNATTSYKFSIPSSSSNPTKSGYTFLGWSKSSTATSASYAAGGTITLSTSDTLYAIWEKTITLSYNVNGGSGSIGSQSATVYNATTSYKFTLSSTKPTRTNYIFLGWATSSSATTPSSSISDGKITLSSNTTLYAVWEKAYVKPKITSVLATRVTVQEDSTYKTDDEGVSGAVSFKWSAGTLGGTALVPTNIKVECSIQGKNAFKEVYTETPTGTSGSVVTDAFQLLDENGSTELSQDTQYDIKITVTDSDGSNHASTFISKAVFIIDVNVAGDSVSIGEVASDDESELFNVGWDARFRKNVSFDDAASVRQNINFIGTNPLASLEEDTTANWASLGTGVALIDRNGVIAGKPISTGGFIHNLVVGDFVFQTWYTLSSDTTIYKRAGNANGWYGGGDWVKSFDSRTPQYIKIYKTEDEDAYSTSYNYFDPLSGGVTTSILRGNLEAGTYTFGTYGDRSDYTVRGIYIGEGINTIRVSYSVRFLNNTTTDTILLANAYRFRNGSSTIVTSSQLTQGYGRAILSGSSITTVQEGDFIFLQGYRGARSLDVDVMGGNYTQLVVEAIR